MLPCITVSLMSLFDRLVSLKGKTMTETYDLATITEQSAIRFLDTTCTSFKAATPVGLPDLPGSS